MIFITGILAACGGTGPTTAPSDSGDVAAPTDPVGEIRFSCGGRPFTTELLLEPPTAEQAAHPAAAALRAFLQSPAADGFLPRSGWLLAGLDDQGASFVAQTDGDPPFAEVEVEHQPGGWRVVGWGECRPRAMFDNLNDATWVLDPSLPAPGREDREFVALVTETACASGQSSEGRIVGPAITYGDEEVLVVFAVRKPPGGDVQECPGNPATRIVVVLEQPLGNRRLLDGGVFPPHDPSAAWP